MEEQQQLKTEALASYRQEMIRIYKRFVGEDSEYASKVTKKEVELHIEEQVSRFKDKLEAILMDGLDIGGIMKKIVPVVLGYYGGKEVMFAYKKGRKKVYYRLYDYCG